MLEIIYAFAMTTCVGCMTYNDDHVGQDHLVLCPVSNKSIVVRSIHVVPDDGHLIIAGRVEAFCIQDATYKEHVEISVIAPDGKLMARVRTNYLPREIPNDSRNPFRYATYAAKLSIVPPAGSKIRVAAIED